MKSNGIKLFWFMAGLLVLSIINTAFNNKDIVKTEVNSESSNSPEINLPKWDYAIKEDKMRNQKTESAILQSVDEYEFKFPYNGGSKLGVVFRKENKTYEAFVVITKGQMDLGINDGIISVKFDNEVVRDYRLTRPDHGVYTAGFIQNKADFMKRFKKAKNITIEAPFHQDGLVQFNFVNDGIKKDF